MSLQRAMSLVEQRRGGWVARGLLGPTSDQLTHVAHENNWLFLQVSLDDATDKKSLMRVLAEQLDLPTTFGANWDAFADVLWDLGADRAGTLLRLKALARVPDLLAGPLVEILDDRTHHGTTPFIIVADPPLPALVHDVNPREDNG